MDRLKELIIHHSSDSRCLFLVSRITQYANKKWKTAAKTEYTAHHFRQFDISTTTSKSRTY